MKKFKIKISYNSPVILSFSLLSLIVVFIGTYINYRFVEEYFMVYRSSLFSVATYFRMFSYVLGHSGWTHFISNFSYILLLGPMVEEKYGSEKTLIMILITAFVGGLVHFIFFPYVRLCGASGIVFMLIILSSITSVSKGDIPLTLILVVMIYMAGEIYNAFFVADNISQITHILGGVCGAVFGMPIKKGKNKNKYKNIT